MDHEGLLLMQAKHGDQRAFESFLERFWKPVFNLAYRFTSSRQESEDLCQEVFFRVYKNMGKFRGEGKAFTWVYRIATNLCLNWKRKNKILFSPMPDREQASNCSTSYEALMRVELQQAFASLSKEDRLLLLLAKFHGLLHKEIGEILSIPEGKVKSRLHEAKTRLGSKLGPFFNKGDRSLFGQEAWLGPAANGQGLSPQGTVPCKKS